MIVTDAPFRPEDFVPDELTTLADHQTALPAIAKTPRLIGLIAEAVKQIPTSHSLYLGDAREMKLKPDSVHLVVTSPPYWTLKESLSEMPSNFTSISMPSYSDASTVLLIDGSFAKSVAI